MRIGIAGSTHLGVTLARASEIRGFEVAAFEIIDKADLVFITQDVDDHSQLDEVNQCTAHALLNARDGVPVVLVSQVPPGFTRKWAGQDISEKHWRRPFYYQVDTIIMNRALLRATIPERIIVGCADPITPIHPNYIRWLEAFDCPILQMSYESAEMCKLAVNYCLARQVETANLLSWAAKRVGADWDEMIPALQLDARIGKHAYLRPGTIEGSHLPRDVKTIEKILDRGVNYAESSKPAA